MKIKDDFNYLVDQFDDMRVLKYKLPGFENLSLKQKKLIFYLSQAALSGRDIIWAQNFRYNIQIRRTLEAILEYYEGDRNSAEFMAFEKYAKRVFFANGIHHHYSNDKLRPGFSSNYLAALVMGTDEDKLPLEKGQSVEHLLSQLSPVIFDEKDYARKIERLEGTDMIEASAINLYENLSQNEAEAFYDGKIDPEDPCPVSAGLNSKLIKREGRIVEEVYRSGGLYGNAIDEIVKWLKKSQKVAESVMQKKGLYLLIEFYRSGDLKIWNDFNVLWVKDTKPVVDYNNGFIETYSDPLGIKATWEAIVNYTDPEATRRTSIITANAQWFEDNSPIQSHYKKEHVKGVAAKVITIAMLGGDCYPVSPLGINLPNASWIRKEIGSKSVTLANITEAYDVTSQGNGFLEEFAGDKTEIDRIIKFGSLSDALHTDLHECVGHASGKLAPGTDPNALKNYASALEEARADLFALYFIMDKKILELGLLPGEDAAKASYDTYLRNGLLTQIVRIEPGKDIEEAHMRNRAAISYWVYEKGRGMRIVELVRRNGKSYVKINDYYGLRILFGELLSEIQRIKSEGDYEAGKEIIETFGIKVDPVLHKEILARYRKLNLAPYTGFVNPELLPVYDSGGEIIDVKVKYVNDYLGQMLYYGKHYSFL